MPALSADDYVRQLLALYSGTEEQLLRKVAQYAGRGLDSPSWLTDRIAATSRMKAEVTAIVSRLEGQSGDLVRRAVVTAHREGWAAALKELDDLGEAGLLVRPSVEAVARLAQTAVEGVWATHLRILRETMNAYQTVLGAGAQEALQASLRGITTQTVGEGMMGTFTRRTATQAALNRIADAGITGFVDKAGRAWSLQSYVEMATRSATAQATIQGKLDAYQQRGHDLVIVSNSPEECQLCRRWEGAILSISGQSQQHQSVDAAINAGLFHPNCTHNLAPYLEGVTEVPSRKDTANAAGYEDRMRQRAMERNVRHWKRREAAALDDATKAKCRAKVKEWQGKLRQFTRAKGRPRLYYREQLLRGKPGGMPAPGPAPPAPAPGPPPAPAPAPAPAPPAPPVVDDAIRAEVADFEYELQKRSQFFLMDQEAGKKTRAVVQNIHDQGGASIITVYADKAAQKAARAVQRVHVIDRVTNMGRETVTVTTKPLQEAAFVGRMARGNWITGLSDEWRALIGTPEARAAASELDDALRRIMDDLMPADGTGRYANLVDGELRPQQLDRLVGLYLTDAEAFARQAPELFLKVHGFMREVMPLVRRMMPDGDAIELALLRAIEGKRQILASYQKAQAAKKAAMQPTTKARPVGTSWKEIDACQTEAQLDDWLLKNWNCTFEWRVPKSKGFSYWKMRPDQYPLSLAERKRALRAVADEMDRDPFVTRYIEGSNAMAHHSGGGPIQGFGVNWQGFRQLGESYYRRPRTLADAVQQIEGEIDDELKSLARWRAGQVDDLVESYAQRTESFRGNWTLDEYIQQRIRARVAYADDLKKQITKLKKSASLTGGYTRPDLAHGWLRELTRIQPDGRLHAARSGARLAARTDAHPAADR